MLGPDGMAKALFKTVVDELTITASNWFSGSERCSKFFSERHTTVEGG